MQTALKSEIPFNFLAIQKLYSSYTKAIAHLRRSTLPISSFAYVHVTYVEVVETLERFSFGLSAIGMEKQPLKARPKLSRWP